MNAILDVAEEKTAPPFTRRSRPTASSTPWADRRRLLLCPAFGDGAALGDHEPLIRKALLGGRDVFFTPRAGSLLSLVAGPQGVIGLDSPDLADAPTIGRFAQKEPNSTPVTDYTYVHNSPAIATDPSGRTPRMLLHVANQDPTIPDSARARLRSISDKWKRSQSVRGIARLMALHPYTYPAALERDSDRILAELLDPEMMANDDPDLRQSLFELAAEIVFTYPRKTTPDVLEPSKEPEPHVRGIKSILAKFSVALSVLREEGSTFEPYVRWLRPPELMYSTGSSTRILRTARRTSAALFELDRLGAFEGEPPLKTIVRTLDEQLQYVGSSTLSVSEKAEYVSAFGGYGMATVITTLGQLRETMPGFPSIPHFRLYYAAARAEVANFKRDFYNP